MPDSAPKSPIRLLLIDDEKGFTDILSKRLAKRGIRTTRANSGKDGLHTLRESRFDVAVLDLKMEDMDGLEVLKIMKILDPEMPVIMLTGHGSAQAAQEGLEAGASQYLTKPFDFPDLVDIIFRTANGVGRGPEQKD